MKEYAEDTPVLENNSINIDLVQYWKRLKSRWKSILIWTLAAAIVGAAYSLTIPRRYTVVTRLAPELSNNTVNRISALSQLAGLNATMLGTTDAVYPMVYPDIMNSTDFLVDLFDTPVSFVEKKERIDTTLYEYMLNHRKGSALGWVMSLPGRAVGGVKGLFKKDEVHEDTTNVVDPFRLTNKQFVVANGLKKSIQPVIDKKTMVLTIQVTMQDPNVAATVAKTVNEKLKEYVSKYRTEKAVHDLDYYQKIYDETKAQYLASQSRYARFVDNNQGMVRQSSRVEQTRLQNEASLNYQLFNNAAVQLQNAKAKVQHDTPVFAEIINPTVPLKPSKPSRKMITLVFMVLGFGLGSLITLIKK